MRPCASPAGRGLDRRRRRRRRAVAEPDHRGDERRRRRRGGARLVGRHGRRTPPGLPRPRGGSAATGPPDALPPGPVRQRPGAAVPAPLALSEAGHPGRSPRRHRVPRPRGLRRHGQHRHRLRDPARRPVAAVQPARRPARRPRRRGRADGGGQHRPGAAARADHGPHPLRGEPAGAPVLRRPLPLRALRPAHPVADRRRTIRGCR